MITIKVSISLVLFSLLTAGCKPQTPTVIETQTSLPSATTPVVVDETDIDYNSIEWTDLTPKDNVTIDIRQAKSTNFLKVPVFSCGRCFLKPEVAKALKKVNQELIHKGFKLKLFDCYRPTPAQQKLWDKVPNPDYVARPSEGSMHSRGSAIDLTLTDLQGNEIDMGTPYDFFGREAHQDYTNLPQPILSNRLMLKSAMEAGGFQAIRTEWWHFSFGKGMPPLEDWQWPCEVKSEK